MDENERRLLEEIQFTEKNVPWKSVFIYAIVGFFWIGFSDRMLQFFARDYRQYAVLQSYKGGLFILITSILLFFVIRLDYSKTMKLAKIIVSKNQELISYSEELIATEEELSEKIKLLYSTLDELNEGKQLFDEVFNSSNTSIMIWNLDGEITEVNSHFCETFQYEGNEVIGKKWFELIIPIESRYSVTRLIRELKANYNVKNFEAKACTKDHRILDILWNDTVILNPKTNELSVVSYGIDVTSEKLKEKKVFELAYKDDLTGFGNRTSFIKDMNELIEQKTPFTLFYMDLDSFRTLNDVHGHYTGDLFLKDFSKRLKDGIPNGVAYRWGGDEFMMIEKGDAEKEIEGTKEKIVEISQQKWLTDHVEYRPTASIGIVRFPNDGSDRNELLKNADITLHHAKLLGIANVSKFNPNLQARIETRLKIENAIHSALSGNGFQLYYQPIYSFSNHIIASVEVLLRWKNNALRYSTSEFIAVAEETGQILEIDRWVIENAFSFISNNIKNARITTSINLSTKTLGTEGIVEFLEACLKKYGVDPSYVELEITEHSLMKNIHESGAVIKALKNAGFKIALDDFGTRYSSLNYLCDIPFDTLKIDKSYVDRILSNSNDQIIVEQIIQLSKRLRLKTVAEGIEEKEQSEFLRELGCDYGQGYLFSYPLEEKEIISALELH